MPTIKNRCDFKDRKCYLYPMVPTDINNTYKILEFTGNEFPGPKYIRSTVPQNIYMKLVALGVKHPGHWFTAQLLGYMILRRNTDFEQKFQQEMKKLKIQRPYVAMHIRRGDKGEHIQNLEYKPWADKFSNGFFLGLRGCLYLGELITNEEFAFLNRKNKLRVIKIYYF